MKKQFVTYPIALAVYELGFNEQCLGYYYHENGYTKTYPSVYHYGDFSLIDGYHALVVRLLVGSLYAPLWQQVIDWFEESYIYISIFKECIGSDEWEFVYRIEYLPKEAWKLKRRALSFKRIDSFKDGSSSYSGAWSTRYEAQEEAILKAIEIVKKNKK